MKWRVALGACWLNLILLGSQRSSGLVFVALMARYQATRGQAAWFSGLFGAVMCLGGPLGGFLSGYFSVKTLLLFACLITSMGIILCYFATSVLFVTFFYGALQGLGIGLIVTLNPVIVNQYFSKNRAIAGGIASAGSCVGSFILPFLVEYFLEHYDLSGTFLLMGGISLNAVLGVMLYQTHPAPRHPDCEKSIKEEYSHAQVTKSLLMEEDRSFMEIKNDKTIIINYNNNIANKLEKEKLHSDKDMQMVICKIPRWRIQMQLLGKILSEPMFYLIGLSFTSYFMTTGTYLMVLVDYALDQGHLDTKAVLLVSIYSAGDLVGRLGCGWLADWNFVTRRNLVSLTLGLMGALFVALPRGAGLYSALAGVSLCLGVLSGCLISNFSAIMTEYLGLQRLALAMGLSTFSVGALSFTRPLLIGYFRDRIGSYDHLMHTFGGLLILAGLVWRLEPLLVERRPRDDTLVT